jgi:hypothetical protein
MKKILHFQVPVDEEGIPTIPAQDVGIFNEYITKTLLRYYKVIFTPFKITTNNTKVIFDTNRCNNTILIKQFDKYIKDTLEREGYIVELIK